MVAKTNPGYALISLLGLRQVVIFSYSKIYMQGTSLTQ
ncbi:hypothetical protein CJA_3421 [Cellvibrio japonicus Ueda107]|uniref:Uncharacterized protein n=1 Tax=Cellvibrio japonicus (strain Ueda107) TaxID=498211 RepID=B3PFA7_CELJU|nr:hypothetical protein CJA_3421 [Cellvibrio japonicus Ueda107]